MAGGLGCFAKAEGYLDGSHHAARQPTCPPGRDQAAGRSANCPVPNLPDHAIGHPQIGDRNEEPAHRHRRGHAGAPANRLEVRVGAIDPNTDEDHAAWKRDTQPRKADEIVSRRRPQHVRALEAGPEATRAAKRLVRERPDDGDQLARIAAVLRTSPEGQDGLRAFLEKRQPRWKT